jgi:hypothetical protein
MKPDETSFELLKRNTKIMIVITKSHEIYQNKPARPQDDINVGMSYNQA